MNDSSAYNTTFSGDGLTRLKAAVQQPGRESIREVAKQFESLFVQTMLKSMRNTGMEADLLSSEQTKQYRGMFDQEIASRIAQGRGMGLASMVERQLLRNSGMEPQPQGVQGKGVEDYARLPSMSSAEPAAGVSAERAAVMARAAPGGDPSSAAADGPAAKGAMWRNPREFAESVWPLAERAAAKLDVSPRALVAQAALETGWGQHVIHHSDGRSSNNLFNIKAHRDWGGETANVSTLEYRGGAAQRERAEFRSYESLEAAFDDYVDFLESNPRYRRALEAGGDADAYVQELQEAGYATDPNYAEKLQRIMRSEPVTTASAVLKDSPQRSTT